MCIFVILEVSPYILRCVVLWILWIAKILCFVDNCVSNTFMQLHYKHTFVDNCAPNAHTPLMQLVAYFRRQADAALNRGNEHHEYHNRNHQLSSPKCRFCQLILPST